VRPRLYFGYLARRTLVGIAGLFAVVSALIVAVDLIEALREVEKVEGGGFRDAAVLTLLRVPQTILTLSPFVFLFGTLWAFGTMAKASEVSVMRAAGLSVWRLVLPPALLAAGAGFVTLAALDPLAARLEGEAQAYKNRLKGREGQMLEEFREDIWLREGNERTVTLVHAGRYDPSAAILYDVTIWRRTPQGGFLERWDASAAEVSEDAFILADAKRSTAKQGTQRVEPRYALPVSIDLRALREDLAKPTALSVWTLPEVAEVLDAAGLRTVSYRLRYHDLWALPLKLAAMTLIGCAFAIGIDARSGGALRLVGLGVGAGFILFVIAELSAAVAEAAIVPVALAAWVPGVLAVLLATGLLLFREDG
jgi:lipopolysaccharide export system permease protein